MQDVRNTQIPQYVDYNCNLYAAHNTNILHTVHVPLQGANTYCIPTLRHFLQIMSERERQRESERFEKSFFQNYLSYWKHNPDTIVIAAASIKSKNRLVGKT